ncbi:MAG: cytochrome c maturation protein CcmE [Dongiaceae bacterium]
MTRKSRRLWAVVTGMVLLALAAGLVLYATRDSLSFFYAPADIAKAPRDRGFRLGGLVEAGSVTKDADGLTVHFRITDMTAAVPVTYTGVLPDLFREGQGVVAAGRFGPGGGFVADEVLAKHDERYMPKEVVEALKKSGRWQETAKP